MKKIILLAFLVSSLSSQAQLGGLLDQVRGGSKLKLFKEETLSEQYKKHVGEVLFSNDEFTPTLPESKAIKTYKLGDFLFVRGFFANSPVNNVMLQLEGSGMKPQKINQSRDEFKQNVGVEYRLFFDGKQVTRADGGKPEDMLSVPTYATRVNDNTDSNQFGKNLYKDLIKRKDLLTPGTHKLKIEVFPKVIRSGTGSDFEFKSIAVGEIDIVIAETEASQATCWPHKEFSDAALEGEILKAVKKVHPNAFKILLNSKEEIQRQEYTGVILSKIVYAVVISKTPEKMTYDVYIMQKDYDGSKYLPAFISKDPYNYQLPKNVYVNKDCLKFLK